MNTEQFFLIQPELTDSEKEAVLIKNLVRLFKGKVLSKKEIQYLSKKVQSI
jgi:hypothetical protein